MKLGVINRITRESLGNADLPKWMDPFLTSLNQFIEQVGKALLGNLTFEDNFLCKVVVQEFTNGVAAEVNPKRSTTDTLRAIGVIPIYAAGETIDKFGWSRKDNGNIEVVCNFGTGPTAKCTMIILLGA
jgi:hypothetical protein